MPWFVALLPIARSHVVHDRVPPDMAHRVGFGYPSATCADDDREFSLVIQGVAYALCIPYPFTMCNDRFGWFAENDGYAWHRILGRLPCIKPAFRKFLGVVDVVLAHTKDVACGPRDWSLQLNCCQRHGITAFH